MFVGLRPFSIRTCFTSLQSTSLHCFFVFFIFSYCFAFSPLFAAKLFRFSSCRASASLQSTFVFLIPRKLRRSCFLCLLDILLLFRLLMFIHGEALPLFFVSCFYFLAIYVRMSISLQSSSLPLFVFFVFSACFAFSFIFTAKLFRCFSF